MRTGCSVQLMNHRILLLKPILHSTFTNWNLNKTGKKRTWKK